VHRKPRKPRHNQLLLNSRFNRSLATVAHNVNNVAWSNSSDKNRTHNGERNVRKVRRRLNVQRGPCDSNSRRAKESHHPDDSDRSNDA